MKAILFALTALSITLSGLSPLRAAEEKPIAAQPETVAQTSLTRRDILNACVQNRAETLPNPFVDVPENHWAYKAVLTLYYCGPYRQATPPALIERLIQEEPNRQQTQLNPS